MDAKVLSTAENCVEIDPQIAQSDQNRHKRQRKDQAQEKIRLLSPPSQ